MFRTKKSLGQNFLINPHILDKIVSVAEITKNDTVIEIGPGTGNLTKRLAEKSKRTIAIERDRELIPILKENLKDYTNIEIIEGDILKLNPTALLRYCATSYKIVANIPYYITSHLLKTVFEEWPKPELIVLTIQREVAQRIMAKPPHMNLLALSVQYYSEPEIMGYISKNNFRPVPKVDSAIIRLKPYNSRGLTTALLRYKLFELIRVGFSEKRKQLAPILSKKLKIEKEKTLQSLKQAGVGITARAENLSLEQWELLEQSLGTYGD